MGQPGRADDVARGVDALDGRLVAVVHLHVAAVELHLGAASEHAVEIGHDADGGEQHLGLDLGLLVAFDEVDLHRVFAHAEVFALRVHVDLDALLVEGALEGLGDLLVLDREDVGQHLDERDLRAERVEEVGELDADGAGADDHDRLGLLAVGQGLARGHHAHAVIGQAGDRAHLAAGRDEDVLRLEEGTLLVALDDLDHAGGGHGGLADDVVDLVLAEERLDALGHLAGDAARALHDRGEIEADLLHADAVDVRLLDLGVELGALEQGLGRDAAPVETGAAGALHLDARDFLAELAGANGARVARGAAADDDEVVFRSGVSHDEKGMRFSRRRKSQSQPPSPAPQGGNPARPAWARDPSAPHPGPASPLRRRSRRHHRARGAASAAPLGNVRLHPNRLRARRPARPADAASSPGS